MIGVNDSFRKEPDAEKPHVRISVMGVSTRHLAILTMYIKSNNIDI